MALAACPTEPEAPPAAAKLVALTGKVEVRDNETAPGAAATPQHPLRVGQIVATGADSKATVEFTGGNRIELGANATLLIGKRGGGAAEIGAVLLGGNLRATSGAGVALSIGTPFGLTELQGGASADIDSEKGFAVIVGEVAVLTETGERKTVDAGSGFSVDGLVVKLGENGIEGLTAQLPASDIIIEPLTVVLLANPKQVQVRRAGSKDWGTAKKREILKVGDAIRTRKANNTALQLGDEGTLQLSEGSELTLAGLDQQGGAQAATYGLDSGSAIVRLDKKEGLSDHTLRAAGNELKIGAGTRDASVEVNAGAGERAQVVVRSGHVTLPDGTVIGAGSRANVEKGKLEGKVMPLADTDVSIAARSSAIVYYLGDVPPVALSWNRGKDKEGTEGGFEVEVARDKDFSQLVFQDRVESTRLVLDKLGAGKFFWRVKVGDNWQRSIVNITKGSASECSNCNRVNFIDDTGEKTVVYFQQALPSLTFRWKQVNGASRYRIKVFSDGNFDTPLANQTISETTLVMRPGDLQEGKYYWLVIALDERDKEISTSPRMNALEIAYDNAVTDLTIKTPRHGSKTSDPTTVTTGEIQIGARLAVNGKNADIDEKGRFREAIPLARGLNRLVYRSLGKDGVERYYIREVYRR